MVPEIRAQFYAGDRLTGTWQSVAEASSSYDRTEYRQATYGPPSHYCDPARALASSGTGTLANPWNLTQAMALAVSGNVVGFLPGVGVTLAHSTSVQTPTLNPANSGTIDNRIVFVTKFGAVALPNVATNGDRTELRHDGTGVAATGGTESGTGASTYGSNARHFITWDGFYVDTATAEIASDTGVISVRECTGVHVRNFHVKGKTHNAQSNAVIYRPNNALDTVLENFRCTDFRNDPTGSNTPQRGLFSDQYGDRNFVLRSFEILDCDRGPFLKGTANGATVFNYGLIERGLVRGGTMGARFNDLHATQLTTLQCCIFYGQTEQGITMGNETTPARNLLVQFCTVVRGDGSDVNAHGPLYVRAGVMSNVRYQNNLFTWGAGAFGQAIQAGENAGPYPTTDYNGYYMGGDPVTWAFNGAELSTIGTWRTAIGGGTQDQHSQVLASSPFVDLAGGDVHIVPGHAAATGSSTGGALGCYGTGATIGVVT